jgi:tripartite-type tricarboxylate transporter receptor subunit TctC
MAPDLVTKLQADLKTALQDKNVQATLDKIGATPVGNTASEFDAFMHAEVTKWEPVLKAANIRAQ